MMNHWISEKCDTCTAKWSLEYCEKLTEEENCPARFEKYGERVDQIWRLMAQQEEPRHDPYYEDLKRISPACTEILRLFKEKGILDEEIIEYTEWGDTETYTIQRLLNEIVDEYTKVWKECDGTRHVGMIIGYRSPYCNAGRHRTNRDTCWYCGGSVKVVKDK